MSLAIASLIVMGTVDVTQKGIKLSKVDENTDIKILMPIVLVGGLCLANLITSIVLCKVLGKTLSTLLCLLFSFCILGVSGYLIVNIEKLDKIKVIFNKGAISASKALFYVTGAFGLLTGVLSVVVYSAKLMNKSK